MLNKDTVISVKTAVGLTGEIETGENIGQGTTEGAVISAASIDYTVGKSFETSSAELSYGPVKLAPLLFQDDICRVAIRAEDAQKGNNILESALETKLLDFNLDKSCYLIMGNKSARKTLEKQLRDNPLKLCKQDMQTAKVEKYLGDMLCEDGLGESVHSTVLRRKGQTMLTMMEICAIIKDCRVTSVGGIVAGIQIWETSVIPFLLNNCETWVELRPKTTKILEEIQLKFLRNILATPITCPQPALLWDTGCLSMEQRIAQKKLLFYHHLVSLPDDSLASQVASVQEHLGFPGLVHECKKLMKSYSLSNIRSYSKQQWKCIVRKAVLIANRNDLLEKAKNYKKIDDHTMSQEQSTLKPYFRELNVPDARLYFAVRSKMTKTVQMNYKGVDKFRKNHWKCVKCGVPDTQEHIVQCPDYEHLRCGKDLTDTKQLVEYYRKVITVRESSM